jgi:hypothetical protein
LWRPWSVSDQPRGEVLFVNAGRKVAQRADLVRRFQNCIAKR